MLITSNKCLVPLKIVSNNAPTTIPLGHLALDKKPQLFHNIISFFLVEWTDHGFGGGTFISCSCKPATKNWECRKITAWKRAQWNPGKGLLVTYSPITCEGFFTQIIVWLIVTLHVYKVTCNNINYDPHACFSSQEKPALTLKWW